MIVFTARNYLKCFPILATFGQVQKESSEKGGAEVPHPPLEKEGTEVTDLLNTTLTGSEGLQSKHLCSH